MTTHNTTSGIFSQIARSVSFYPLTGAYVGAVAVLALLSSNHLDLGTAIIAETMIVMVMMTVSAKRELRAVHNLVHSQREELVDRIDQLVDLLHTAGIAVPEHIHAEYRGPGGDNNA